MPTQSSVAARVVLPSPEIRVSAPGKLILAGEHGVVYGRPALVVALDARTRVSLRAIRGTGLRLELPDVSFEGELAWSEIETYGRDRRLAWLAYVEDPSSRLLSELTAEDPAHVVKVALAETAVALGSNPGAIALRVESDLPVGAGFGSSASVAVATCGALARLLTGEIDEALIDRVALETERRQHGRPSGADHVTVLHGGVQWIPARAADTPVMPSRLAVEPARLDGLGVFDSGRPAEGTGAVVEAVRRRFEESPLELEAILDQMESAVLALRDLLIGVPATAGLREAISLCSRALERLGVVPEPVGECIRRVEAAGGAAKISGAGALSGSAAGALLAYPVGDGRAVEALRSFRQLDVTLGGPGLRVEIES